MPRRVPPFLFVFFFAGAVRAAVGTDAGLVEFSTREHPGSAGRISRGVFRVYEDRARRDGRTLDLDVVVLHARSRTPRPDPVVYLAGGPGQNAAALYGGHFDSWMRQDRDLVFVSQRGTAGNHRLDVELAGNDRDLQSYLDPIFDAERFRKGLRELERRADLRMYSTPLAMDDLAEVLDALGYDRVNLFGGSYGTRAALVFMRRHENRVRAAILMGVAPLSFKNPLYHAKSAQEGLMRIFEEVENDPAARLAYPDLRGKFEAILRRLERGAVEVEVTHPATGRKETVRLDRDAFCEALRVLMYYTPTNRRVPMLLERAYHGDFTAFAQQGIESNRSIRRQLAFGMLMCVTAAEDIARITDEEIERLTAGTFLGDLRVRTQREVARFWPRSDLPAGFGKPVSADVPVLLISGTHDPVTPPEFGEEAHRHLRNSLHLVVPGAHGVYDPRLSDVMREFLDEASVQDLDTGKLREMKMPRVVIEA